MIKAFSASESLSDICSSLSVLVRRQGRKEQKNRVSDTRWLPLKMSRAESWALVMDAVSFLSLSSFACSEIAGELSALHRMLFKMPDTVSLEIPVLVSGTAQYTYDNKDGKESFTTVSVLFRRTENVSAEHVIQCPCLYSFRLKLPCRHSIALFIHLDKMGGDGFRNNIDRLGFSSALKCLIHRASGSAWRIPMDDDCKPQTSRTRSLQSDIRESRAAIIDDPVVLEDDELSKWM